MIVLTPQSNPWACQKDSSSKSHKEKLSLFLENFNILIQNNKNLSFPRSVNFMSNFYLNDFHFLASCQFFPYLILLIDEEKCFWFESSYLPNHHFSPETWCKQIDPLSLFMSLYFCGQTVYYVSEDCFPEKNMLWLSKTIQKEKLSLDLTSNLKVLIYKIFF